MGVAFLWQTQIQTTKYGIYDMIRIKRIYFDILVIYSLWHEFENYFDAQSDFGKKFLTKNLLTWTILILSIL